MMYSEYIKNILDRSVAVIAIALLSPLLFFIFFVLLFTTGGKPFFLQDRSGKNEKIFKIIKFRTMQDAYDRKGNLVPDEERVSRLGRILRNSSLDELPQLINILKGEMSMVGPRPLLVEYLPYYNDFQRQRHKVLPGITGWAQVNGRNSLGWVEKFELDVWYVKHISFKLDLRIIYLTFVESFKYKASVNNSKFKGN